VIACKDIFNLGRSSKHHSDIWTNITLSGIVEEKGTPYKLENGTELCQAKLRDDSGLTAITLWETDIDIVQNGCMIKIVNGMVKEINGEKRFSTGFLGHIEILGRPILPQPVGGK
jgi:hypothetical protein